MSAAKASGRILLNPFVLVGLVLGAPFLWSVITRSNVMLWVQVLVVALAVFAVWIGLAFRAR